MSKDELLALIEKNIVGQGNQIDIAGTLPNILTEIVNNLYASVSREEVGELASLNTDHKSNIVEAINEIAGLIETPHFEVSFSKTAAELKDIYDACVANITLAKNIVFFNANDNLYYRVNGYAVVNEVLKLHVIMQGDSGLADTVVNLASNGTISIG